MSDQQAGSSALRALASGMLWMITGILIGAIFSRPLQQLPEWVAFKLNNDGGTAPSCSDRGWYRELLPEDVQSYSQFQDFTVLNLSDGKRDTAWVARLTGNAEQDYVSWSFSGKPTLALICLRNGYTKTYSTMANNQRVRQIELSGCGPVLTYELPERLDLAKAEWPGEPGRFDDLNIREFEECTGGQIKLVIKSTYPAADGSTTFALADVRFYTSWDLPW